MILYFTEMLYSRAKENAKNLNTEPVKLSVHNQQALISLPMEILTRLSADDTQHNL